VGFGAAAVGGLAPQPHHAAPRDPLDAIDGGVEQAGLLDERPDERLVEVAPDRVGERLGQSV